MATFMIRVLLHGGTWDDYVDMAKCLAGRGIIDVIVAENGVRYKLPPGEYTLTSGSAIEDVLNAVKACANTTAKANAVVVSVAERTMWNGLEVV